MLDLYSPHLLLPQQTVYNCPILQQDCKDSNEVVLSRIRDFVLKNWAQGGIVLPYTPPVPGLDLYSLHILLPHKLVKKTGLFDKVIDTKAIVLPRPPFVSVSCVRKDILIGLCILIVTRGVLWRKSEHGGYIITLNPPLCPCSLYSAPNCTLIANIPQSWFSF